MGNKEGKFLVKSCYKFIFRNHEPNNFDGRWIHLWKVKIHDRLKIFLWRIMANVIPTHALIFDRLGKGGCNCVFCYVEEESLFHLFKECYYIRSLAFASKWGCKLDC